MKILFRRTSRIRRAGDAYRSAAEWRLAAEAYGAHLADHPGDGPIWVQLGHMEKEAGTLDAAEAAYRRAAVLMPMNADVLLHLGHLLKRQSRKADALDTFRSLFRLQPDQATLREIRDLVTRPGQQIAGEGVLAIGVEGFLRSIEECGAGGIRQLQAAIVQAMMTDSTLDTAFFVSDRTDGGAPGLLSLDKRAFAEIMEYALAGAADRKVLWMMLEEARLSAVPLSLRAGSTIVDLGSFQQNGAGIAEYLEPLRRGARLVLLVHDLASVLHPQSYEVDGDRACWQRLAELAYAADLVIAGSDDVRAELARLMADARARELPVRTLPQGGRDAGAGVIEAIHRHLPTSGPIRGAPPVLLHDGSLFDPGLVHDSLLPIDDQLSQPMSLELAGSFYPSESSGAWLREDAGDLIFKTTAAPGEAIIVFLKMGSAAWAAGGRFSVSFATSRAPRRWLELSPDGDLIRIEGVLDAEGTCTLLFAYEGEWQLRSGSDRPLSVALKAIGYVRRADVPSRLRLREQFIFDSAA